MTTIHQNRPKMKRPLAVHVMAKPSGAICNIDCTYCFYLEKEKLYPDGTNHVYGKDGDGYEIVTWNNQLDERPLLLPVIGGTWTITISGSGLEGIGSILYSGDYSIRIESDKLE